MSDTQDPMGCAMEGDRLRQKIFAFERNTIVRAGAGTGKTEALATVYLHLIGGLSSPAVWPAAGVAPEKLVALTFTEKAAREMRERISDAVALLTTESLPVELGDRRPEARANAARRWGSSRGVSPAVVARVLALADSAHANGRALPHPVHWQQVAWKLGTAHIGTFHSFAAKVLRRTALSLDLDPGFTVLDTHDADRLLRDASLSALARYASRDVTAVVELMASAGGLGERDDQGLVDTVSSLVRRVEESGESADHLGVATACEPEGFQSFIAAEVFARFAAGCDTVKSLRADGTSARMVELARAVEAMPTVHGARESLERLRALQALPKLPSRNRTRRLRELAQEAHEALAGLKSDAIAEVSRHLGEAARTIVATAQRSYEASKRKRSAVDYSDLMRLLRDALRDRAPLRRELKARYDALFVDEFQDTNKVQRDLLYLLRERRDAERTLAPGQSLGASELEPQGLLLVGDAKQSIYAFRGAEVSVFIEAERELEAVGGDRVDLTVSYRAVDTVVEVVNKVTGAVLAPGAVTVSGLYTPERDALVATETGDETPRVELLLVEGGRADAVRKSEAEAIAERIAILSKGTDYAPRWRPPRMDEIAILVPSWSQVEPIERALQSRAIPYALRGGPGFWQRQEIDDLVTLLRFVSNPSDRLSLAAVLRGPLVGLTDAALARLFLGGAGYESVLDPPASVRSALCDADRDRLDEARPTLRRLVRFGPSLGPEGVLRQCLVERGYTAVLARLSFGAQRVANVDKLIGLAAAAEQNGGEDSRLAGFVEYIERARSAARRESDAIVEETTSGSVTLMSIHAAKGLEWPVVFVAQTSRRRLPRTERVILARGDTFIVAPGGVEIPERFQSLRQEAFTSEYDDQRRLVYVALTRARDLLVVSGPDGSGDGTWKLLHDTLRHTRPERVRVIRPGEISLAPTVSVRTRSDETARTPTQDTVTAGAVSHQRLAITSGALQDLAWCRRRFHALQHLGSTEHLGVNGTHSDALKLVRTVLTTSSFARVERSPTECVKSVVSAGFGDYGTAVTSLAVTMLERFAQTSLARSLAAHPEWVVGRGVPWALALGAVTVTGEIELLIDANALGKDGFAVIELSAFGEIDGPESRGGVTAVEAHLQLALACRALRARIESESENSGGVTVKAARLTLGEDGPARVCEVLLAEDTLVEARVDELALALERAQATGRWEPRPRWTCEALRCGLLQRCYG